MIFFRFLNLVEAVRQLPSFPAMDAVEERMLNTMAATWHAGTQISVMEAMHMFPQISPSTVHRRLKSLRAKGLIELMHDERDSRVKYITATALANQYFSTMSLCMEQARS